MKLAIIADVHSNLYALEAVLESVGNAKIYHAGDVVGYNPFPKETIEIFKERGIPSVMGNHDRAVAFSRAEGFNPVAREAVEWTRQRLGGEELEYLASLPPEISGENFAIMHGSPRNPIEEYVFPGYPRRVLEHYLLMAGKEVLILGHTHIPMVERFGEGIILNPGSVGQPRDKLKEASFAFLNSRKSEVEIVRVDYPIEKTARAIRKAGLPGMLADRLFLGS